MSSTAARPPRFEGPTRYVRDARSRFDRLREAAEEYPKAVAAEDGLGWMRRKPYDDTQGHPSYFGSLYAAMNAIQAMRLPLHALVVEVGSGPGWLTEILVGLGHRVVAVEPSGTMNELAAQRLEGFCRTTGIAQHHVTFHTATLEEAELGGLQAQADGVIFHEALHHVIDEHEAARRVFSLLKPGRCVAVCGEGRWTPGDTALEHQLDQEMLRYQTLESPFTQPYLRHVLETAGFTDIGFHHSVNGLFEESLGARTVQQIANPSASGANTVIAWRPIREDQLTLPRAAEAPGQTSGSVHVVRADWREHELCVQATVRNTGTTYWPMHRLHEAGGITLALCQQSSASPGPEASSRAPMPKIVFPDEEVSVVWQFGAPHLDKGACYLRLVVEDVCWLPGATRV